MSVNFICPCCGYHATINDEICQKIRSVVHNYLEGVEEKPVLEYERSKEFVTAGVPMTELMFTLYFVRLMTGAPYKDISPIFHVAPSIPSRYFNIVHQNLIKYDDIKIAAIEMEGLIKKKFVLEKILTLT